MGRMEENNKRKARYGEIQKIILESVKTAGILSIGLMAPNVIGAMKKIGLLPNKRQKEVIESSASKLVKKGMLRFNGKFYELTPEGQRLLRRYEIENFHLHRPRKWDKKWRVVIFDIPEKKRKIRTRIRTIFASAGLFRLQDSVWVFPYDCEDVIGLLKTELGVGRDVLYMIVEEIENDRRLRDEFNLM